MPRLRPPLLSRARTEDPLLARLLPTCRDLASARNELRWIREHVSNKLSKGRVRLPTTGPKNDARARDIRASSKSNFGHPLLKKLCIARGRGKPLQYILGTEFFGDLELECRPGVLVPRPETAEITTELVRRLVASRRGSKQMSSMAPQRLRVLDLCTGTGCMSLLFQHELAKSCRAIPVEGLGVDISPRAIALAKVNLERLRTSPDFRCHAESSLEFARADVLARKEDSKNSASCNPPSLLSLLHARGRMDWDILLANPPYISPHQIWGTTARSVRNYEPRIALVPSKDRLKDESEKLGAHEAERDLDDKQADLFYPRLLTIASALNVKVLLMEVGDTAQALRVARMAAEQSATPIAASTPNASSNNDDTRRESKMWKGIEIWRDGIGAWGAEIVREERYGGTIVVKGPEEETAGRAVVCWRCEGGFGMST